MNQCLWKRGDGSITKDEQLFEQCNVGESGTQKESHLQRSHSSTKNWKSVSNLKQAPKTASSPRVIAKAVVDKPLHTGVVSGPTTQSKYAQALANTVNRGGRMAGRVALIITELAQAVLDDDPKAALEFANEIFDADYGQMLKYRKLISHPKHCDV
jgi:hypothetical protein